MAGSYKFLVFAIIVYLVWKGLKALALNAAQGQRRTQGPPPPGGFGSKPGWGGNAGPGPRQAAPPAGRVEDLVACRVCGTYIASRGGARCAREDCPQGHG